ncbi:MAG: transglutaminase family protein [Paracoccaceae bacterium]
MRFSIKTHLLYEVTQPTDVLLQIQPFANDVQLIHSAHMQLIGTSHDVDVAGEEGLGTRKWVTCDAQFECHFQAEVTVSRRAQNLTELSAAPRSSLPSAALKYLWPSRYCHPELFLDFVSNQFADLTGGALVAAMCDWINNAFTYDSTASPLGATATDSFQSQSGVCRDYAHVLITLVRAAGIPARFVSVYAWRVFPKDFHAVVEVYLDGAWHLVDPTGMADPVDMVCICVGRDAADTAFMTSYGWMNMVEQSVVVERIFR